MVFNPIWSASVEQELKHGPGAMMVKNQGQTIYPAKYMQVTKKLEDVLESKNQVIKALKYDVSKVSKAHNDLIRVYEAKLAEYGIPAEELGFRPLVTNTSAGPAGLVVGA